MTSVSMQVIRPTWTRAMSFTSWSKNRDLGLMRITAPAKDKGVTFLKIKSEGWNWLPTIERVVKISPAQMAQSWMGSDFTNEDVLKEASIIHEYTHAVLGEESVDGVACYKIEAIPKPNAPVVWGRVLLWIGKADIIQRKAEYRDEDGGLVNTLYYRNVRSLGGRTIPTTWEMIPAQKPGHKSVVTIQSADFSVHQPDSFFSQQTLRMGQ